MAQGLGVGASVRALPGVGKERMFEPFLKGEFLAPSANGFVRIAPKTPALDFFNSLWSFKTSFISNDQGIVFCYLSFCIKAKRKVNPLCFPDAMYCVPTQRTLPVPPLKGGKWGVVWFVFCFIRYVFRTQYCVPTGVIISFVLICHFGIPCCISVIKLIFVRFFFVGTRHDASVIVLVSVFADASCCVPTFSSFVFCGHTMACPYLSLIT